MQMAQKASDALTYTYTTHTHRERHSDTKGKGMINEPSEQCAACMHFQNTVLYLERNELFQILRMYINSFETHRKTHLAHPILTLSENFHPTAHTHKKGLCDDGGVDIKCAVGLVSMCRWLPFKIIFMYFRVCLYTFRCN